MRYPVEFFPCEGCGLPSSCRAARRCARLRPKQEDDEMHATTIRWHVWAALAPVARDEATALPHHLVMRLTPELTYPSCTVPNMHAKEGYLARTDDMRYYVDASCRVPSAPSLADLAEVLARRNNRRTT
jgi:hypothetical protein